MYHGFMTRTARKCNHLSCCHYMNENFESAGEQYHIHGILGDLRLFKGHNGHIT